MSKCVVNVYIWYYYIYNGINYNKGGDYMKKNIILIIGAIIIFVAGYFIGDASAIKRVNAGINKSQKVSVNNKDNEKEEKKEEGNNIYKKLGEEGTNNSFSYKVLEFKNTKEIKTGSLESEIHKTNQNYCMIKLQMTNKGSAPAEAGDKNLFALVDIKNKQLYYPNTDITIALNSYNKHILHKKAGYILEDLNPNVPIETTFVFEIPTEVKGKDFALCVVDAETKNERLYLNLFK
ncbi:DUF4352 domain-containing protein [Clostridium tetani]|nr:DUF4352 domain-containing protein [Clostridium tetani]RXI63673.1 DUF4352 domain-containing protein [Clostridium tetani]RXI72319.1 DUF4352 domain-containing protein [Clostridium tetani]